MGAEPNETSLCLKCLLNHSLIFMSKGIREMNWGEGGQEGVSLIPGYLEISTEYTRL